MDTQLTRVEAWPVRLAQAIEEARLAPFVWGAHDCATWAFSVAASLRGEARPRWIGRYRTRVGAARVLRREGLRLEDVGTAILGEPLASPLMAHRGDVVFARGAYGVCIGQDVAHPGPEGLVMTRLAVADRAWRV